VTQHDYLIKLVVKYRTYKAARQHS